MYEPGSDDSAAIDRAVALLAAGGVVAIPTETVYGLAADALDATAVARVFEIKRRPTFDPLIVHVPNSNAARGLVREWPELADRLARAFWPGPLTLVLGKLDLVPDLVTAGLASVAIRVPDHPMTRELMRRLGRPLAAPSANEFGCVSPTTAQHVRDSLGSKVDYVLDGGPCRTGVESTVISLFPTSSRPTLLRSGGLPREEIERVILPHRLGRADHEVTTGVASQSPGTQKSHYATRTRLFLAGTEPLMTPGEKVGWLGLGTPSSGEYAAIESLAVPGDLRSAAANLFAAMRRLDALGLDRIVAELPPETGIGAAIVDRLRRASRV